MKKRNFSKILALTLLIGSTNSCQTFEGERTYSKNSLTVTYRSFNRFGGNVRNYRIQHPINISDKLLARHLQSLWHRKIDPPGKSKQIFSPREIKDLSHLFVKALKKIKPERYLHFEFHSTRGSTEGDVFASINKIHWRLLKVYGEEYSNDPLKLRKPTWKMVRMQGQKFHMVKTSIDQKPLENWIIANFKLPKSKQQGQTIHPPKSASQSLRNNSSNKTSLKKKLKVLQQLFQDGLINEKDYLKKKESLLNHL